MFYYYGIIHGVMFVAVVAGWLLPGTRRRGR
jgi:hypothetical protein